MGGANHIISVVSLDEEGEEVHEGLCGKGRRRYMRDINQMY